MWNDGYSKEQPWLNYYNSYERMHCCFGDADMDADATSEDTNFVTADDLDRQAKEEAAAMAAELEDYEGLSRTGSNVDEYADVIGTDRDGGYSQGLDYNDYVDMGVFDYQAAESRANDQRIADEIVENQSALGRAVDVTLDKEGNFVYEGADAFTAALGEIGKGASYLSQNIGIGSAISALARELGITEKEVEEQVAPQARQQTDQNLTLAGPPPASLDVPIPGPRRAEVKVTELGTPFNLLSPAQKAEINAIMANDVNINTNEVDGRIAAEDALIAESLAETQARQPMSLAGMSAIEGMQGPSPAASNTNSVIQPTSEGRYAQGVHTINTPLGPITFDSRDSAMTTGSEVDSYEPPIIKPSSDTPPVPPIPTATELPAIQAYFERLGIGPATPALNPSISTYAEAYGIPYAKAAEMFARPSVPAMGGGGLRSLMEYS